MLQRCYFFQGAHCLSLPVPRGGCPTLKLGTQEMLELERKRNICFPKDGYLDSGNCYGAFKLCLYRKLLFQMCIFASCSFHKLQTQEGLPTSRKVHPIPRWFLPSRGRRMFHGLHRNLGRRCVFLGGFSESNGIAPILLVGMSELLRFGGLVTTPLQLDGVWEHIIRNLISISFPR